MSDYARNFRGSWILSYNLPPLKFPLGTGGPQWPERKHPNCQTKLKPGQDVLNLMCIQAITSSCFGPQHPSLLTTPTVVPEARLFTLRGQLCVLDSY